MRPVTWKHGNKVLLALQALGLEQVPCMDAPPRFSLDTQWARRDITWRAWIACVLGTATRLDDYSSESHVRQRSHVCHHDEHVRLLICLSSCLLRGRNVEAAGCSSVSVFRPASAMTALHQRSALKHPLKCLRFRSESRVSAQRKVSATNANEGRKGTLPALKEWAVTLQAMSDGWQHVCLRKPGSSTFVHRHSLSRLSKVHERAAKHTIDRWCLKLAPME